MGIKEDAVTLLVSLATYGKEPDDPNRGTYQFPSAELPGLTGLTPNRINDAADYLAARGLVKLLKALGSHPFNFIIISVTTQGRVAAEERTGAPQAHEIDKLISLYNRGKLDADLSRVLAQHKSASIPVALCMLDIDHFKTFNDNYGHQSGDQVLKSTAAVLRNTVGNKGTCYRYGGEELCAILPNYTLAEVEPLAERIRASIENSSVGTLPKVTVSLGVALTERAGYDATALLKAADGALYAAKREGRNRVVVAAP